MGKKLKKRIDRWKKSEFVDIPFTTTGKDFSKVDKEVSDYITEIQRDFRKEHASDYTPWDSPTGIMRSSRELIFDIRKGKPIFYVVGYFFNVRRGELQIIPNLEILMEGGSSEEINQDVLSTLAAAFVNEVPVYPNTDKLSSKLAEYYRELMVEGFLMSDEKGQETKVKLIKSPGSKIESIKYLEDITITEPRHPAEIELIRITVKQELEKLSEATHIISSLELAIKELGGLISEENRNEPKLQDCFTKNPVLFGLEYKRIIPKHKLGDDYEMDYALQHYSGLVDLLELESSNLPVFNKKGNPSHYLIHAEQQVLDWLSWIEENHPYAKKKLPGIMRPRGFVVIGSSKELNEETKTKLHYRNAIYRGIMEILTYDDVLDRAKTILQVLSETKNSDRE